MVLDSSAVVAILLREREGPAFVEALTSARTAIIGAPSLLEVQMVLLREYPDTVEAELERFLSAFDVLLSCLSVRTNTVTLPRLSAATEGGGIRRG